MRTTTVLTLVLALTGCARGASNLDFDGGLDQTGNPISGGEGADGDVDASQPATDGTDSASDGADATDGADSASDGADATDGTDSASDGADGSNVPVCPTVMCTSPMDAGEIVSDVDSSPKTIQGSGPAFVRVLATDGQASGNAIGGMRAELVSAAGANYDLYVYGDDSDACADLNHPSLNPAGQSDVLEPAWGTNGPVVTVDRTLTFEVRPTNNDCTSSWTLTLTGNPCPAFTLNVSDFCE